MNPEAKNPPKGAMSDANVASTSAWPSIGDARHAKAAHSAGSRSATGPGRKSPSTRSAGRNVSATSHASQPRSRGAAQVAEKAPMERS